MSQIKLRHISKSFNDSDGTEFNVLDNITADIAEGSFTSIMGPSGCGKSTLLNIIAGLLNQDEGKVEYGDETNRGDSFISYVFQEPRLLNWLTVGGNIRYALKSRGVPKEEHQHRVKKYLQMVGLDDEEDSYPLRLSGGMQQRVGVARALAVEPQIILMDEPFSSLDEITAQNLRKDIIDLWQKTNKTVVFVTHDISEAVYLSDEILFMNDNGIIFNKAKVNVSRPREVGSKGLLERESDLMNEFFSEVN